MKPQSTYSYSKGFEDKKPWPVYLHLPLNIRESIKLYGWLSFCILVISACSKNENPEVDNPNPGGDTNTAVFDINSIKDTYYDLAPIEHVYKWGPYNVHDPSIVKDGDTYYCYSTDAAFGAEIKPGLQIRKSKDLIKWDFVGWVFNDLPAKGKAYIASKGGEAFKSLWAPYVIKAGSEYRLYYSLSSALPRVSVIGLATSTSPIGPWKEKEIVVTSTNDNSVATNAIDPTVLIDRQGQHWMYYGSSWDAIYILKLNSSTGLAETPGNKGVRIAHRGFTGNTINGNIEGPEIIYNPEFDMYYLFIAYDWLQTKYNVRVGRSKNAQGPFLDYEGRDLNDLSDNFPMIIAPYQFNNQSGWQGTAHQSVFTDDNNNFYIAHQARPGENSFFMVLHVRELLWSDDGWPMASCQRYAGKINEKVTSNELLGKYELINFKYNVVPGFSETQTDADITKFKAVEFLDAGKVVGFNGSWEFDGENVLIALDGNVYKCKAHFGRDWENKIVKTVLLTGLDAEGKTIWLKKIKP